MARRAGQGLSSERRALLARLHLACRDARLSQDAYRDFLERQTGERSAAKLSEAELARVILALHPRRKSLSENLYARKLMALWLSAWNLGLTQSKSEQALAAFVERQTGLSHPRFMIFADDAAKAIEGLKCWIAREAGVAWGLHPGAPVRAVVEAQWRRLKAIDAVEGDLESWAVSLTGKPSLAALDHGDWLRLTQALGVMLRRELDRERAKHGRAP